MKTAIYPGTFDPITYGHIDVIKKSLNIFDRVIIATTDNINKNYYFSINDRVEIINNSLFKDLKLEEFQTFHNEFKEDIYENLNPMNVVKSRNSLGGTGFDQVKLELNNWKKK